MLLHLMFFILSTFFHSANYGRECFTYLFTFALRGVIQCQRNRTSKSHNFFHLKSQLTGIICPTFLGLSQDHLNCLIRKPECLHKASQQASYRGRTRSPDSKTNAFLNLPYHFSVAKNNFHFIIAIFFCTHLSISMFENQEYTRQATKGIKQKIIPK